MLVLDWEIEAGKLTEADETWKATARKGAITLLCEYYDYCNYSV